MTIFMLDRDYDLMVYGFENEGLERRLMGAHTGEVSLPHKDDLPLRMVPRFGEAKLQPKALGDLHSFEGGTRLFSERAVEALSLSESGRLFPVALEGRVERFYWYWSTTVIDCLDGSKTKRMMHLVREPAFFESKIGDTEIFTTPDDQKFQFHLYVSEAFRDKVKRASLKGFVLRRGVSDQKPWKS